MSLSVEEIEAIETVLPLMPEDAVVFDVGANSGAWTDMILERKPQSAVHLFEPNSYLIEHILKQKYSDNENIFINDTAAYKEDGKHLDFFYFTNENNGLSSIYHNEKWDYLPMQKGQVQSITLDTYCKEKSISRIDILKIDVEGAELDVLHGCWHILNGKIAKYIQVEYSEHYQLNGRKFMDVVNYVRQFGYSAYFWQYGDFVKITEDNFVENYRLDNFILTFEALENVTQHWNSEFIKNTLFLKKQLPLVIEFGSYNGLNAKYICENLLSEYGRLVCVDPLQDTYLTEELDEDAVRMNKEYGFFKKQYFHFKKNTWGLPVELIRKRTNQSYAELEHLRAALVYIDGDHRKKSCFEDGKLAFKICDMWGYILFDDFENYSAETTEGINDFMEWAGNRVQVITSNYQLMVQKIKP